MPATSAYFGITKIISFKENDHSCRISCARSRLLCYAVANVISTLNFSYHPFVRQQCNVSTLIRSYSVNFISKILFGHKLQHCIRHASHTVCAYLSIFLSLTRVFVCASRLLLAATSLIVFL